MSDWAFRPLGELIKAIRTGPFGSSLHAREYEPGGVPVINPQHYREGRIQPDPETAVGAAVASRLSTFALTAGEVIVARRGEMGRCAVVERRHEGWLLGTGSAAIRPKELLDPAFLAYFLRSPGPVRALTNAAIGTTMANLNQKILKALPCLAPPVAEQRRIVAAVDTYFSRLDSAVASLKRAKTNVKRARTSVLQTAVEGRLVPTEAALACAEGRDYEPAAVLLARILAERKGAWEAGGARGKYKEPVVVATEELPELPRGWSWTSMDALAHVVGGLTKDAKRVQGRSVPYLRVANVQRGRLELSEIKTILATEQQIEALRLQPGDILLNEGGDRDKLGRGWIWRGELTECIHQNHVFRARLWMPAFDPRYLSHYANTEGDRYFTREGKQTTNLASISLSKVKAMPVALPPSVEIKRILDELDRRLSVLDALDATIDANLARCASLRQSILQRAFDGRLVSRSPAPKTGTKAPLSRGNRESEPSGSAGFAMEARS